MTEKILCVDDDPMVLFAFQHDLGARFLIETAPRGDRALELIRNGGRYAVIVADMMMPGMNGLEVLARAQVLAPDTVRIMLTANEDRQTAVEAINQGAIFRFLSKPYTKEEVAEAIEEAIRHHRLITAERELLDNTFNGAVQVLSDVLSMTDPEVFGRGQKLRDQMRVAARAAGLGNTWELDVAARLSQVGMVTVPAGILAKSRAGEALNGREASILTRVPEISAQLLENIPRLERVAQIVLYQAKHFDGSSFPNDEVAGNDIPAGARLLKILLDLAELEATGMERPKAFEAMAARTGWYDPSMLALTSKALVVEATAASRPIRVKWLAAGQVLAADLEGSDGAVLVPAGTQITGALLERIRNFAELSGIKEPVRVVS